MIEAGELREIIKIQQPVRIADGSGGFETTYNNIITKTYAKVVEETSKSVVVADQDNIYNKVHFRIRYRPIKHLKLGYRLVWRDFNFTINNIKVDPFRTSISILVSSDMETSER